MIKTIKKAKCFTFRDLMEYIFENNTHTECFVSDQSDEINVLYDGTIAFEDYAYNTGELYEVEVEEEITEDMEFEKLIWFDLKGNMYISRESSIAKIHYYNDLCKKIYVYHNDEFSKIWERE